MSSPDQEELKAHEAWLLEDPEQRLQELATALKTPAMSQQQPEHLSPNTRWHRLLDPMYRFDFDDATEDAIYGNRAIRSLIDENRTNRRTAEQSRRSFVHLRVLRMGAFLLRAAEASQGPLPIQRSTGRIAIESLLEK